MVYDKFLKTTKAVQFYQDYWCQEGKKNLGMQTLMGGCIIVPPGG
jgi:hypothetical protein